MAHCRSPAKCLKNGHFPSNQIQIVPDSNCCKLFMDNRLPARTNFSPDTSDFYWSWGIKTADATDSIEELRPSDKDPKPHHYPSDGRAAVTLPSHLRLFPPAFRAPFCNCCAPCMPIVIAILLARADAGFFRGEIGWGGRIRKTNHVCPNCCVDVKHVDGCGTPRLCRFPRP